jgi:DNA modification methylase
LPSRSLQNRTGDIVPVLRKTYSANGTVHSSNNNDNGNEPFSATSTQNKNGDKPLPEHQTPNIQVKKGDARQIPLSDKSVDLVITSPPYWRKRDYEIADQIGQEETPREYVDSIIEALREWRRVLRPTGSVFLNIGDTYWKRSLTGIPGRIEAEARDDDWIIRNRIIWAKDGGMPEPAQNRLANRHEYILHLSVTHDYYYDMFGYSEKFGNGANPGDVWNIGLRRNTGNHLAPFPEEIVERVITLACPVEVCSSCGKPRTRIVRRTANLDPNRPQAKRAMELAKEKGLTPEHIAAIQATGISDAGKAMRVQNGTGRNSARVKQLALEAKTALGGYFREFTFAKRVMVDWTSCECNAQFNPGVVLDPFMGTGTTLRVAARLGRSAVGVDLAPHEEELGPIQSRMPDTF